MDLLRIVPFRTPRWKRYIDTLERAKMGGNLCPEPTIRRRLFHFCS